MEALVVCCDIHIDNVSILQGLLIRNAMADHLQKQEPSHAQHTETSESPCTVLGCRLMHLQDQDADASRRSCRRSHLIDRGTDRFGEIAIVEW